MLKKTLVLSIFLVTLSLICLCNAKSKQDEAALLYSKKTLSFVTSNSRVISQQLYRPLLQECVSIVAKIKEIRLVDTFNNFWSTSDDISDPHHQHTKANLTKNQLLQSKRLKNDSQIVLPIVVMRLRIHLKLPIPSSQFTILFKHWIRLWVMLILKTILFQSYCYTENNDFSFIFLDFLAFTNHAVAKYSFTSRGYHVVGVVQCQQI